MRTTFPFLAAVVIAGALTSGCSNVEHKFSRGVSNMLEPVRLGEIRRSVEQTALFDRPRSHYTSGFVDGLNHTLVRTSLGIYEVVTCPLPPYDPLLTGYLQPSPVYPDNYAPGILADSLFATDTNLGFSGGDIAPFLPGSRFLIFETH
jgi:putative exosortase-associated protein (TIGR04073 family)